MQFTAPNSAISLPEIISSLSYALDLTSGYPIGHAQRTCLIGLRLAKAIGLSDEEQFDLYHALLMKDAGCSSNSARMAEIFGNDDITAKQMSRVTDWSNLIEAVQYVAAMTLPHKSLLARAQRILHIATHKEEATNSLMRSRCERGAQIALSIGLNDGSATCIRALDEHWNGKGGPLGLKKDAIPLLGRIACLAQTLDVFVKTFDVSTAYAMLRKRSGKWFDPELVRVAQGFENDRTFWNSVLENPRQQLLSGAFSQMAQRATDAHIDAVCDAFAQIVDAKSPFTAEHTFRVRDYSVEIGQAFHFAPERLITLRRAALLHDLGKLAVSNTILDKPGRPTDDEWTIIRKHPYYTQQILQSIPSFGKITEIAAAHHERLDGRGYFQGLSADQLDLDMRILAVADVFDALSAKRPYRDALSTKDVFAILGQDSGVALDAECIEVLKAKYQRYESVPMLASNQDKRLAS